MFNDEETKEIQKEHDKKIRNSKFSRTRRLMKDVIAIIIGFSLLLFIHRWYMIIFGVILIICGIHATYVDYNKYFKELNDEE